MDTGQQRDMLNLLKTLADEQRLTMLTLMRDTERTVTDMVELLKLNEPAVTQHIKNLHNVGLLQLRMAGTQRFYRLNERRLAMFKAYVAEIELPPTRVAEDKGMPEWIAALDWDEADKKVLQDHIANGRLTHVPTKDKKLQVIVRWLATRFEPGVQYTEKEVNARITQVHEDYATLRRALVDFGFMRREQGGGSYWLTPQNEQQ